MFGNVSHHDGVNGNEEKEQVFVLAQDVQSSKGVERIGHCAASG